MQLKYVETINQATPGINKVTALCWAPSGRKLALCTADRMVILFDETGARRDKFPTKPADKGPKNYIVRQMAFSPQSDKIAIAQSDNMVFVYKLGSEWGEKKSICNKFQHLSSITTLVWPTKRTNEIVYGLAEGKVKIGQMKTHKPSTLYQTDSFITAMTCNIEGSSVVTAHLDGSIYIFNFDTPDRGARMICRHNSVPSSLAWATSIVVAGNNGQVVFYDEDGGEEQVFDMSDQPNCKEFGACASNPTGDAVILGNFNNLYTFTRNKDSMSWENKGSTYVENMYSVTAMSWKPDGDKVAVGTLCGALDLYDICVKRAIYKGGFELTFVSHSQVIVRQLETNLRIVVRSQYGREILKTNIYRSRYVVANTSDTILLGDLETLKLSEIQWHGNGNEKFIFDNASACMIYYAGEITIVEYGTDEALDSVRTSFISSHVISLRINERPPSEAERRIHAHEEVIENKKIAYLLDAQTICVKDLFYHSNYNVLHDSKIDWLELNGRGNLLLFRDKRRYLHLYNIETQQRNQLLNFCTYVQWVPNSDVVVAQNRTQLCVWYNINAPDQITSISIKGDVEEIERVEGRTEVIVDEGITQAVYPLDESLINFGSALDDQDFVRAMDILDRLMITPDVEVMWKQLKEASLVHGELRIVTRCCAALGDVATGRYIQEMKEISKHTERELGYNGMAHYQVRSKMSLLLKDFKGAELELLNQGRVNECIDMYQKLFKHEDAIRVAEQSKHPELIEMRQAYFQYLLDTSQDEKAAALKVHECDFIQAINLYLKGGMPGKAAQVIIEHDIQQPLQLLDTVATALYRVGLHDKAGEFYERLNELPRALDCYIRGNAYRKAVDLARKCFPARVVELQEQWGDHLVNLNQIDMAINHYIEAKVYRKAIEAALNARQYTRALQLIDAVDRDTARPYYKQLARYYEDSRQFDIAERCFISAEQPHLAVEMHTKLGNWEIAHKIAMSYLTEGEVSLLYINQAQKLEAKGRLKEAEKLYLTVKEKDLAINMYKKHRRFEDMIRLVQEHRSDLVKETHQFLAQTLEMEGSLREAEHHYVQANEWHSAVNMYRSNELWDDAIRVAKFHGGINACKRVTIALLMAIGVQDGAVYLTKHGLVEAAIDHAAESGAFDLALELANQNMAKKLPDIHLKHALFLEEDERFVEAEEEFIKANKPKEAIDMYVHQNDWTNAIRVAEKCDPTSISEIYIAQAKVASDGGDYHSAEELYLLASRPELALQMYQEAQMWNEAMKLAQMHLPHRVGEMNQYYQQAQARAGKGTNKSDFISNGKSLEQNRQWNQAVDNYLNAKAGRVENMNDLIDIWERAVEIARTHVPNRHVEVALEVASRLSEINQEEIAADILFDIGRHDEAITILLKCQKYEKAKSLAKGNNLLKRKVDEAYQSHLITREDTKELVELGQSEVALDVLAKRGDWDRLWEVATKEKLSPTALSKYVILRIDELLKGSAPTLPNFEESIKILLKRAIPVTETTMSLYKRVTTRLLSCNIDTEQSNFTSYVNLISNLREILYKQIQLLNQATNVSVTSGRNNAVPVGPTNDPKKLFTDLQELLMVIHYQNMFYISRQYHLRDLMAKCAVSLLQFIHIIPQDKAFYQAGIASREQGNVNLAFLLLNRYVDISEAIDAADPSYLDTMEFQEADAIPLDAKLPKEHYLVHEDDREEIRTWVLSVVTDSSIEQRLPPRESSRNTLYEGLYSTDKPKCIVTGYPIHPADMLEVNSSTANRRDWNVIVSKTRICPWTGQPQNPLY